MNQRSDLRISREETLTALVALGEDPLVSRVEAVLAMVAPMAQIQGDRESAIREAISVARRALDCHRSIDDVPSNVPGTAFATMDRAALSAWYVTNVGYNPTEDDPNLSDLQLRADCLEMHAMLTAQVDGLGRTASDPDFDPATL